MKRFFDLFRRKYTSPHVIPEGNHLQNLARHPQVDLAPVGTASGIEVPIWIEVAPDEPTPHTYDGLLWEVEPMGEYLYYLAGDFPRNEKGLLRYGSATLSSEVHVSFETDSIEVALQDEPYCAAQAREACRDDTDLAVLTVAEAQSLLAQGNDFALLRGAPDHSHIQARAWIHPLDGQPRRSLTLTTCLIDTDARQPRKTLIRTSCARPGASVAPLVTHHQHLVERYRSIAHLPLSGAIRM